MKKCITGVGLLLAALILFGCQKQMAEMTLDKFPEVQTVTLSRTAKADDFDSGLSGTGNLAVYAVRINGLKDKAKFTVNTVFNDAYLVSSDAGTGSKLSTTGLRDLKVRLGITNTKESPMVDKGGDFVVGDDIIVGYRRMGTAAGNNADLIIASKVVKYHFVDEKHVYMPKDQDVKVALHYSVFDDSWYARAEVGDKYSHMSAKFTLWNNKNDKPVYESGDVDGRLYKNKTVFVWKIDDKDIIDVTDPKTNKIGRALHPSIEFTDKTVDVEKVKWISDDKIDFTSVVDKDRTNAWGVTIADVPLHLGSNPTISTSDASKIKMAGFSSYSTLFTSDARKTWTKVEYYLVQKGTANPQFGNAMFTAATSTESAYYSFPQPSSFETEKAYVLKIKVSYGIRSKEGVHGVIESGTKEVEFSFKTGKN